MPKKRFFTLPLFTLALCATSAFSAGYYEEDAHSDVVQNILLTKPDGVAAAEYLSHSLQENFDSFSEQESSDILGAISRLNQKSHASSSAYSHHDANTDNDFLLAQLAASEWNDNYQTQQKQCEDDRLLAEQLSKLDLAPPIVNHYGYVPLKQNPELKEKFKGIHAHLQTIAQHADVHVLDDYVFGAQKTIMPLLEIGRFYELGDKGDLTLSQVGIAMAEFVNANQDFFTNYKYEDQTIGKDRVVAIIQSHFNAMDGEILPICTEARELWSRAWTLSQVLFNQHDDFSVIKTLFDEVIEGHLTNGGCIQGRINRGFVGYVSLLGQAGVGSYL